jgi:arylsulfatase A-like enzyme
MSTLSRRQLILSASAPLALGSAGEARPNILFLFPDQHRFDWTGANKELNVRTPNLDALARRGTRFTKAIVASPLCAPSRACLAAGKEYDRCGVPSNRQDYPLEQPTFYTLLRNAGYQVLGCGKFDLHKATEDWGLDGKRLLPEWGFTDGVDNAGKHDAIRSGAKSPKDPYMAFLHAKDLAVTHVEDFAKRKNYSATFPTPLPETAYCDNWLAGKGVELLRRVPKGQPWFIQVNFTGPHAPMDITRSMEQRCRGVHFPQPNRNTQFTPEVHVAIRQNYTAMVENIDSWVGLYFDEVRKRGELDNTLVVFSSDHGEMLGDHGRWGKSVPWQPSIGVPLYVAGPGVKAGVTSNALVSHMDFAATFLEYGGVERPKDMDSRSMRALLEGRTRSHREYAKSGLGEWRAVWDGRYKLVRSKELELYDLHADPLENENLAAKEPNRVTSMAALL